MSNLILIHTRMKKGKRGEIPDKQIQKGKILKEIHEELDYEEI